MQRTLVDDKRWIGQRRFLHAMNYCMLLPGPEAQQLATYVGWLLHGTRGRAGRRWALRAARRGRAAGPVGGLRRVRLDGRGHRTVRRARAGGAGDRRPGRDPGRQAGAARPGAGRASPSPRSSRWRCSASRSRWWCSRPALVGWALGRQRPAALRARSRPTPTTARHRSSRTTCCTPSGRRPRRTLRVLRRRALVLGGARRRGRAAHRNRQRVHRSRALFFSGAAVVTFGGAYAVLAYVAQQAVQVYGWLAPGEMVRGLALAETTPGPLIMVVQFVAFVGAYRDPGDPRPVGGRGAGLAAGHLGDVRAELPVRLPRRPVHGAAARQPVAVRRAQRDHRGRRRGHREPRRLLRGAHAVLRTRPHRTVAGCPSRCPT